jgi:hypothetical protein
MPIARSTYLTLYHIKHKYELNLTQWRKRIKQQSCMGGAWLWLATARLMGQAHQHQEIKHALRARATEIRGSPPSGLFLHFEGNHLIL